MNKADGGASAKSDRPLSSHIPDTVAEIPGLGPIRVRALEKAGLGTIAALSAASFETLMSVPGLTEVKARHIMSYLSGGDAPIPPSAGKQERARGSRDTRRASPGRSAERKPSEDRAPAARRDGNAGNSLWAKPAPRKAPAERQNPPRESPPGPRTEPKATGGAPPDEPRERPGEPRERPATDDAAGPAVAALMDEIAHARRQIADLLTGPHAAKFRKPLAHALTRCIGVLQTRKIRQDDWSAETLDRVRRQVHRILGALAALALEGGLKKKAQARTADQIASATDKLLE